MPEQPESTQQPDEQQDVDAELEAMFEVLDSQQLLTDSLSSGSTCTIAIDAARAPK